MGLETPLALLGLATVVLPILAHRLQRRDLVPVPLPTFALLQRAQSKKRRSRGLTDWLLLLLRIAILALASIALGAPFVTARLTFGDGSVASVAFVVDDSMSMTRRSGASTQLAEALARAREALASLPPGSEVAVIAAGAPARVVLTRTDDLVRADAVLRELPTTTLRGTDLQRAYDLGLTELAGARHEARRLLVLSDFAVHARLEAGRKAPSGVDVQLERTGDGSPATNLFFTSITALPDPTTEGQTSIAFELGAVGQPPPSAPVVVVGAGHELARVDVATVDGKGRATVHVPTPEDGADPTALLRIDTEDALDADNVAGVLLRRASALRVMMVNGDPHPASADDELSYAMRALRLAPSDAASVAVRAIDASVFDNHDLSRVDVVVMANVPAPGAAVARRLQDFVQRGGGLLVAAGDKVRARAYNDRLGDLLPCRLRAVSRASQLHFAEPSSPLFPHGLIGLSQARTERRLVVESESHVELRFEDGSPALVSREVGRGRVLLLTTTLDDDWSDLPLRPGYLPLLTTLVRSASHSSVSQRSDHAEGGEHMRIDVPPGATRLEVVTPDGERYDFEPGNDVESVDFEATHLAGPYRVLASTAGGALADSPRNAFVITTPVGESDVRPAPIEAQRGRARATSQTLVRRSITSPVFFACALLMLAEGVLRLSRR